MPMMQRLLSLEGAKAWCQTHHPLKMILNTVKATWGAYPMHLSPVGLGRLLTPYPSRAWTVPQAQEAAQKMGLKTASPPG
jgi:hypothetical protein